MITGVETAGLVLGSIPLILAGLEFYAKGIAVTRRCFKYREQFHSLIVELGAENAICINSLNLLLVGTVKQQDMAEFLSDPCGDRWKDERVERKLKQRLGTSYESYMATIKELNRAVEMFKQRLRLNAFGKPQFDDEQSFKKYYKRLEFSLRRSDYDDLMGALRRSNFSLHQLTTQTMSLEQLRRPDTAGHTSIPNYNAINNRAQGFHSALKSGWQCSCLFDHSVNLRLESRIDDSQNEDSDDEESMRSPFHVLFCYSDCSRADLQVQAMSEKPWTWDEAKVRITVEDRSATASGTCVSKVRFANQAHKAVKAALDPVPDMQPIQDMCAAISTLQKAQRAVCLSLLAKEYAKQEILIYPSEYPPVNTEAWSVSSLRNVLRDPEFARRNRLQLAVTLASSVLQLHETPWLKENWRKDDILFIKRSGVTAFDHPFVSQCFGQATQISPNTVPPSLRRIIRNQTLYALGIALIELWYGRALSELWKPEDGELLENGALGNTSTQLALTTEWNIADRLVDELYSEAGGKYSDAVRRCIRCDFDRRASSLEDAAFQRAVYQGVVTQLQENFEFLY